MALTSWSAFVTTHPEKANSCTQTLLVAKGISVNEMYILEVDPATGKIPVDATLSAAVLGFGDPSVSSRGASQIGNATGAADFDSGASGAQTLRVVLATRHEASATPVAARIGNGANFADFGAGANAATVLRITPATDAPHLLATRHEAAATPLATRSGNGTNFDAHGAGTVGADVQRTTPASDSPHLLATRHEASATPLSARTGNGTNFSAYGAGAVGADVQRTTPASDSPHLLATRHEAAATPLATRLGNGTNFADYGDGAAGAATMRVVQGSVAATGGQGSILGTALTGTYATALTLAADAAMLFLRNSCNQEILVSLDGTNDHFTMGQGDQIALDLKNNGRKLASGATIKAKHTGVLPGSGKILVTAIY